MHKNNGLLIITLFRLVFYGFSQLKKMIQFCIIEKMHKERINMNKIFKNQIADGDTVQILMYGDVGDGGGVDSAAVVAELMQLSSVYSKINVRINSRGGDVFSGIAIYNALKSIDAAVEIYVDGLAASIAGVIALCGKPLYMSRYARLMLHRVSGGCWGTADELRAAAELSENIENNLAEMISGKCKMSADEVKTKYFDGGEHWFSAQEAVNMGLADGIFDTTAMPEAGSTSEDIYIFTNRLIEPQNQKNMLFDELKKRPSFANIATEEAMMAHITTIENQAAKVPALEDKVKELTEKLETNQKEAHTAYLNQAVAEGKITKEQLPTFLNLMKSDEANTRAVIEAMPKRGTARVENYIHTGSTGGQTDLVNMSWDEIDKAERISELKNKYPELYKEKFEARFHKNN